MSTSVHNENRTLPVVAPLEHHYMHDPTNDEPIPVPVLASVMALQLLVANGTSGTNKDSIVPTEAFLRCLQRMEVPDKEKKRVKESVVSLVTGVSSPVTKYQ